MIRETLTTVALIAYSLTALSQVSQLDKQQLPQPFSEEYPEFQELYDKAWELAWSHITTREGMPQSPFIDDALSPVNDWIWDTQFMLLYWRYAAHLGPWILTNNNFYKPIHDNAPTLGKIHIPDNPPLFAWGEYFYNKIANDAEHLNQLINIDRYLQRHFAWFDTIQPGRIIAQSAPTCLQKVENGYIWEGGRSGMDNTPRGRTSTPTTVERPVNPNMLWVDAIAQQALAAQNIANIYTEIGDKQQAKAWNLKKDSIAQIINTLYWDQKDGFYYDIDRRDSSFIRVATPASYWVLLAGAASKEQAIKMAEKATKNDWFGGNTPFTTLRPTDPDFYANGRYWRGALWLPTAYMSIKALNKYGYFDLTHKAAVKILQKQYNTYKNFTPHTIWECYSPTKNEPSVTTTQKSYVRHDFCGWSGLGPISLFIEDVLGFYDIDAPAGTIRWNRTLKRPHGIRNLRFGEITANIIWDGKRVQATANKPFKLIVNGKQTKVKVNVMAKHPAK